MEKSYQYTTKHSQAYMKFEIIKCEAITGAGTQVSYNLPGEMFNELKKDGIIVLKDHNVQGDDYYLKSGIKFIFTDNVLNLIGDKYKNIDNKFFIRHTTSNNKYQLIRAAYSKMKSPEYEWFVDLYNKNSIGSTIVFKYNDMNQTFTLDLYHQYDVKEIESVEDDFLVPSHLEGVNKIFYGIPGCGKSFKISSMLNYEKDFVEDAHEHGIFQQVKKEDIFRTTFYLDYSNTDFVGQILPVVKENKNTGKNIVTYNAVPGPFTQALEHALLNPDRMIYLIVEEINRGNAAAIFGDLFQLLDRLSCDKGEYIKGDSEYPISNEFIENYFTKQNIRYEKQGLDLIPFEKGNIYIPHNLTIFATMNTSDQNVFPLDTAFKRRWDRERVVPNWEDANKYFKDLYIPFTEHTWVDFAQAVNTKMLSKNEEGIVLEDKQLGPYFVKRDMLVLKEHKDEVTPENKKKLRQFVNNVIDYLYSDVTKFEHDLLFTDGMNGYNGVYDSILKFDEKGFIGDPNLRLNVFESEMTSEEVSDDEEE